MAPFASPRVWNTVGHTSSAFKVLKKVSTIELSEQFPIADIEIRTPCFLSKDPPHEVPIGDSRCLRPGGSPGFPLESDDLPSFRTGPACRHSQRGCVPGRR